MRSMWKYLGKQRVLVCKAGGSLGLRKLPKLAQTRGSPDGIQMLLGSGTQKNCATLLANEGPQYTDKQQLYRPWSRKLQQAEILFLKVGTRLVTQPQPEKSCSSFWWAQMKSRCMLLFDKPRSSLFIFKLIAEAHFADTIRIGK